MKIIIGITILLLFKHFCLSLLSFKGTISNSDLTKNMNFTESELKEFMCNVIINKDIASSRYIHSIKKNYEQPKVLPIMFNLKSYDVLNSCNIIRGSKLPLESLQKYADLILLDPAYKIIGFFYSTLIIILASVSIMYIIFSVIYYYISKKNGEDNEIYITEIV